MERARHRRERADCPVGRDVGDEELAGLALLEVDDLAGRGGDWLERLLGGAGLARDQATAVVDGQGDQRRSAVVRGGEDLEAARAEPHQPAHPALPVGRQRKLGDAPVGRRRGRRIDEVDGERQRPGHLDVGQPAAVGGPADGRRAAQVGVDGPHGPVVDVLERERAGRVAGGPPAVGRGRDLDGEADRIEVVIDLGVKRAGIDEEDLRRRHALPHHQAAAVAARHPGDAADRDRGRRRAVGRAPQPAAGRVRRPGDVEQVVARRPEGGRRERPVVDDGPRRRRRVLTRRRRGPGRRRHRPSRPGRAPAPRAPDSGPPRSRPRRSRWPRRGATPGGLPGRTPSGSSCSRSAG